MESLVSAIKDTNKRESLNAVLKALGRTIDGWKEDETKQRYGTIQYKGSISQKIPIAINPSKKIELVGNIAGRDIWIGSIDTGGIVDIAIPDLRLSEDKEIVTVSSTEDFIDREWTEAGVPHDTRVDGPQKSYDDEWEESGATFVRKGKRNDITIVIVSSYWEDDDHTYWYSGTETHYLRDVYNISANLSDAEITIFQKYLV